MSMNRYSLKKLAGMPGARLQPMAEGADHFTFKSSTGRGHAYIAPAQWAETDEFSPETRDKNPEDIEFRERFPSTTLANRAIGHDLQADHEIAEIRRTAHPALAADLIAPRVTEHAKAIAALSGPLTEIGRSLQARDDQLYAVPEVKAGDFNTPVRDQRIWNHYDRLSHPERAALRERMQAGKEDEIARALKRTPVPIDPEDAQAADDAWRAAVDRAQPEKAALLKAERDQYERDVANTRAALQYVTEAPEASRSAIATAVRGSEAFFSLPRVAA